MRKFIIILLLLVAMVTIPFINAEGIQPTQQFNKIFLNPFYRETMSSNTNYTYNVTINPPDKISSILSAIISFNGQINGQTQTFTLWVNGQSCNNPQYSIATAFSTTGNVQFSFDCSNVITKAGVYNVTMRSAVNTGVMSGWVDLTYMTNPLGKIDVSGTEYSPNDPATFFIQLKDSQGLPVNNGSCYIDIRYPSGTHDYMIEDAPMLTPSNNDDGLYYYDMVAPSTLGVYMLTAKCSYSYNWVWFFGADDLIYYPTISPVSGSWSNSSQVINSPTDGSYIRSSSTGGAVQTANWTFNTSTFGLVSNITIINVYFSGQASDGGTLNITYWNGTTFVSTPNIVTFSSSATSTTVGSADNYLTTTIPASAIINGVVRLQTNYKPSGGTQYCWYNWLSIATLSTSGTIQEIKGSSEMHITNVANATLSVFSNVTAIVNTSAISDSVWNHSFRNLTYYPAQVDLTNYTAITSIVNTSALDVKLNVTGKLNSMDVKLDNIFSAFSNIAFNVWNYVARYVHGEII